ncbi:MAG: KH domain-containing protein [Patescibacteria group bacterium]
MEAKDQKFLEFLIQSIVDHPDEVKVERKVDEMGVLLTLKVNPTDMAQIIGKGGATAQSIRSLLKIVGIKNNARVNLKIIEPEGSTRGMRPSFDRSADGKIQ